MTNAKTIHVTSRDAPRRAQADGQCEGPRTPKGDPGPLEACSVLSVNDPTSSRAVGNSHVRKASAIIRFRRSSGRGTSRVVIVVNEGDEHSREGDFYRNGISEQGDPMSSIVCLRSVCEATHYTVLAQ